MLPLAEPSLSPYSRGRYPPGRAQDAGGYEVWPSYPGGAQGRMAIGAVHAPPEPPLKGRGLPSFESSTRASFESACLTSQMMARCGASSGLTVPKVPTCFTNSERNPYRRTVAYRPGPPSLKATDTVEVHSRPPPLQDQGRAQTPRSDSSLTYSPAWGAAIL